MSEHARRAVADVGEGFTTTAKDYDRGVRFNVAGGRRLITSLPDGAYRRVLDVGCGTGLASLAMMERFHPDHVTGVDTSRGMLDEFATKLHQTDAQVEVELRQADVMHMGIEAGTYDAVVSTMAFHWFPDKAGATRAMGDALAPGGVLGVLCSGRHAEHEFRDVLSRVDHPGVPVWDAVFDAVQRDVPEMERYVRDAGLEPVDIWMERRIRRVPPAEYLERMRVVTRHLFQGRFSDDEIADLHARTAVAMHDTAGADGFEYTFTKLYAIARRPA